MIFKGDKRDLKVRSMFDRKEWKKLVFRSIPTRIKASRTSRVTVDRLDVSDGIAADWSSGNFGDYYSTSAAVFAAVRVRADAVSRPPLITEIRSVSGEWEQASSDHAVNKLLEVPNHFWTGAELLRAIETNLMLWGSAFVGIERDEEGNISELWTLRPDRMRIVPGERSYVRGFVYEHLGERVAYLPDEVIWLRQFNPMAEFAGISPVAPARLAIDMGAEAQRFNRNFFANSAIPGDLAITTDQTPTDDEVSDFYRRWESRYQGSTRSHRPVLLSRGMDAKRLGMSQRDMEFAKALEWSVEEVSRAFGVPTVFLGELEDATLSNVQTFEKFLWRNTIVPELRMIEDGLTRSLIRAFAGTAGDFRVRFDLGSIEALSDSEDSIVQREVSLIEAGVLTPDEVRANRGLPAN